MSSLPQSFLVPTSRGEIITFYSYKGGTGRSMAVANIACLLSKRLARTSQRVLVMDWDLEAPGLHRFFSAKSELPEYASMPGVINYFDDLRTFFKKEPGFYEKATGADGWQVLDGLLPLEKYCIPDVVQGVDFIRAGLFGPDYAKLVGSFSWIKFFHEYGGVIKTFRELLSRKFAYTLVDSRTGLTDVSGICTSLLPEKLVGVFTPNQQSLYGLRDLVREALEYRRRSEDDFRPLSVFPLPSRIDLGEKLLREKWGKDYQAEFEALFRSVLEIEKCDLTDYFNDVLLPQIGFFAYGEKIAILEERPDAISLSAAYQRFFDRLMNTSYAWESPDEEEEEETSSAVSAAPVSKVEMLYDAFLSYRSADEKSVSRIDEQLERYGVKTFRPSRDLAPGQEWYAGVSAAVARSKAIVVFISKSGSSLYQDQQSSALVETFARDSTKRIIPVLLPGAPGSDELRLPNYLQHVSSVDLRSGLRDTEGLGNLVWALTGVRPKQSRWRKWAAGAAAIIFVVLLLLVGVGWLDRNGYIGAIADARKRVQQNPNDAAAHVALGDALRSWSENGDAIKEYATALRLEPNNASALAGFNETPEGLPGRRLSILLALAIESPSAPELHDLLATAFSGQKDYGKAIAEEKEAIKLATDEAPYLLHLASFLEQINDFNGALLEYLAVEGYEPGQDWARAEASAGIQRISQKLGFQPFPWGILLSIDKQLKPEKNGDPSGVYELELARDYGLSDLAFYQRPYWYGAVAQFKDEASARAALPIIRAKFGGRWRTASVLHVGGWCPGAGLSDLILIDDESHYVPLFKCSGLSLAAQSNESNAPANPTH